MILLSAGNSLENWSYVATIISSLAALVGIIFSFLNVKMTVDNNHKEKKRQAEIQWYNQLILGRLIPELEEFTAVANTTLESCQRIERNKLEERLKECYEKIKDDKRHLRSNMLSLSIFNKELGKDSSKKLEDIFDIYSEIVTESCQRKFVITYKISQINAIKVELIKQLYLEYKKI